MRTPTMMTAALCLALFAAPSHPEDTAQPGVTVKAADLKAAPDTASETLAHLESGQQVMIGARRGGWYAAMVDESDGWLHLLNVRMVADGQRSGSSGLRALMQVGRSDATVTTGVRGLTAEDLAEARENRPALAALAEMQPAVDDIDLFAADAQLVAREVPDPQNGEPRGRNRR